MKKAQSDKARSARSFSTDRSVVYKLLKLVNLIAKPFFARYGKQHSLLINEWRIIIALAMHPGLSVTEICDHTGMHIMNVSRAVRRLHRMGRVEREIDPNDRRRSLLRLSDQGEAIFAELAPSAFQREDVLLSALTPEEAETLRRLLDKLLTQVIVSNAGDSR